MATMKAALHDGRGTMEVVEAPRPEAGPGEVVVRVRCTGICGTDLNRYAVNTTPEKLPSGHEVAGEVVDVGSGAESWGIGDRVAIDTLAQGRGCGHCWYCLRGQYNTCQNKVGDGGGFAEYIKRFADGCFRLPDGLSWEEGALVEPLAVGVHGLRRGNLAAGETVVVLGSGTIGLTTLVAARALGAGKVFLTARHSQQTEMAMRLGADAALPSDGAELWEAVAAATEGRGADVVVETVGGKSGGHSQTGGGGGTAPGPHRSPGSQPFPGARGHAATPAQGAVHPLLPVLQRPRRAPRLRDCDGAPGNTWIAD